MSVADFKTNFSGLLDDIRQGESIAILYGRRKEVVALLTPPPKRRARGRRLGVLEGKAQFRLSSDFKMSDTELIEG